MNIKDSYIHGDLAVVRSIEGLSVGNNASTLVLTYTKAEPLVNKGTENNPDWQQKTYNVSLNNFSDYLDDKFVTLDTAQTVSGKKTFSNGIVVLNGLLFDKGGTATADEIFHIDGSVNFTGNNGSFTIKSTQGWAGFKAMVNNTKLGYLAVMASDRPVYISADQNTVRDLLHSGNYTSYTPIINGSHANSSTSIYSPTSAGTSGQILVSSSGTPTWQSVATGSTSGTFKIGSTEYSVKNVVTTDTNQVITGLKIFNSNTTGFNTSTREITGKPLIIGRDSSATEALHVGVNDNTAYFIHRQDETESNFAFIGTWDDTESGGGAGAGYKRIDFVMNQASNPYISINGNKVWHEGNDGANSGLDADFLDGKDGTYYATASSLGNYLPLLGGILTGNLTIKKSSSDIGTYVTKTDSSGTTIRQLLFGIGSSGTAGIYDYATSSWIVSIAKDSPYAATFNGNASTATALTTNAGNSKTPVYFSGGKPVSTGYDLSTFLTITSAANTYLKLSGGTMTGPIGIKRTKINGEAKGLTAYGKNSDSISGGIGFFWSADHEDEPYIYLATKTTEPWKSSNGLFITSSNITWKGNNVLTSSNVSGGGSSWGSSLTVDGKTLTIPSNPNTDYQVKQSNKTDNVYYPILLGGNYNTTASSIATADKTSQVYQNSGVYVNASTKTIYASTFSGSFSGNSTTSTLTKYTLTSSAYHLVGVNENLTSTATARSAIGRNDVLVTASGAIQAVDTAGFNLGTSATMKYNTTNQSIDFIFN